MGVAEDVTARGPITGAPAIDARRKLYNDLEQNIIDSTATVRGRSSGTTDPVTGNTPASTITPKPSTGQVSLESLGRESDFMAKELIAKAEKAKSDLEDKLMRDVGPDTKVDPTPFYDSINEILNNPTRHDAKVVAHAKKLRNEFQANMPFVLDAQGNPIKNNAGEFIREDPSFSATSQNRTGVGKDIKKRQQSPGGGGKKLDVSDKAYTGLTAALDETAQKSGVPDFAATKAATKQNMDDIRAAKNVTKAKTETGAGMALFGGQNQRSLEQFDPYLRQVPDTLAPIMANALELKLRGEGNAGKISPAPETFSPKRVHEEWAQPDADFRRAYSGGIPEVEANLNDVARVALADANRHGKRSAPGQAGSTIGASGLFVGLPALLGGAAGWAHSPGHAIMGALGAPVMAGAVNYGIGKLMTNPNVARALVNPQASIAAAIRRAGTGVVTEGAWQDEGNETKRRLEQADFRRVMGM
jgi:hypothetical protein